MGLQQWKQRLLRPLHLLLRWKHTEEQLVGLDIGPGFIKLLKLDTTDYPYWIEGFGVIPLPPGAIVKEEIKDVPAISAALREVFDEARIKTKSVALAIPRSATIIKTITVDKRLNSADIESRAWVEANHHFPDLVGDIYLDFDIIGPSAEDPMQLDLLLVACRKDHVKPYVDLLREANLSVKVVDVNCYAFERALALMAKKFASLTTVALLNLDFSISSLIVVHQDQLIYAHDHSYEGLHFKNQVQQYLEANKDKNAKLSMTNTDYVDVLKAGISAHLRHSIHFFYSSRPNIAIQRLVLGGDCADIPVLAKFIQQETGIETVIAAPLLDMTVDSNVDEKKLQQYSASLVLCSGLALSRLKEMES